MAAPASAPGLVTAHQHARHTARATFLSTPLQAYRNTVSVPRHWSQKRKYLQGKRGLEKPPFKLPDFIEATGITEMRNAYHEKARGRRGQRGAGNATWSGAGACWRPVLPCGLRVEVAAAAAG